MLNTVMLTVTVCGFVGWNPMRRMSGMILMSSRLVAEATVMSFQSIHVYTNYILRHVQDMTCKDCLQPSPAFKRNIKIIEAGGGSLHHVGSPF